MWKAFLEANCFLFQSIAGSPCRWSHFFIQRGPFSAPISLNAFDVKTWSFITSNWTLTFETNSRLSFSSTNFLLQSLRVQLLSFNQWTTQTDWSKALAYIYRTLVMFFLYPFLFTTQPYLSSTSRASSCIKLSVAVFLALRRLQIHCHRRHSTALTFRSGFQKLWQKMHCVCLCLNVSNPRRMICLISMIHKFCVRFPKEARYIKLFPVLIDEDIGG